MDESRIRNYFDSGAAGGDWISFFVSTYGSFAGLLEIDRTGGAGGRRSVVAGAQVDAEGGFGDALG